LVAMHCQGLYDRTRATIPGYSAKYVKTTEGELVTNFVNNLKMQQLRLKVELRADPARRDLAQDKALEANARRLEALDRLSLYFCMGTPHDTTIDGVPIDGHGSEVEWELRAHGNNIVSLGPYPFRREPLQISVLTRSVPKRLYVDNLDFQKTLGRAPYVAMKFTLHAGGALSSARIAVAS
jgi:uncharacterized protein DUF3891